MPGAKTLFFASFVSPIGPITVVESSLGLVAVEFEKLTAERMAERFGEAVRIERRARLRASTEIAEYFRKRRRKFGVALDWQLVNGFARQVLERLCSVPFGELTTYGELARALGKPGASRAIGGVMAKNPIPIVVPCHRVVASDGSIGGFSGGLELKRKLQTHEGLTPGGGGWSTRRERARLAP